MTKTTHMTRAARRLAPIAALSLALTLAACGDSDDPPPTETSTAASPQGDGGESGEEAKQEENLDKPEQQQIDSATAKAALPTVEDMPGDGWGIDVSTFSTDPPKYDPAGCAAVELDNDEDRAFTKDHRKVKENIRFSRSNGDNLEITAVYIDSYDEPYPLSVFDAAGEQVTSCESYRWQRGNGDTTRHVKPLSTPAVGDRAFAVRLTSDGSPGATDRLYVRSGHNVLTIMGEGDDDGSDGTLLADIAQDILDELKKTP